MLSLVKITLFATFLFCLSCQGELRHKVDMMLSKHVSIDTCNMINVEPKRKLYLSSDSDKTAYSLIVYYDKQNCMSCVVNKMNDWHKLLFDIYNDYYGVSACFIFSPEISEVDNLLEIINNQSFGHKVYIDDNYYFEKNNPWLPKQPIFHTFLVDSNGDIVFVGDPRRNDKLKYMFEYIIRKQHK